MNSTSYYLRLDWFGISDNHKYIEPDGAPGPTTHTTSGALVGQLGSIAGVAVHSAAAASGSGGGYWLIHQRRTRGR